jgi:hypothetical protein
MLDVLQVLTLIFVVLARVPAWPMPWSGRGAAFFSLASASRRGRQSDTHAVDWTDLRDRWEYSHVARAGLAALSFIALVIAISGSPGPGAEARKRTAHGRHDAARTLRTSIR